MGCPVKLRLVLLAAAALLCGPACLPRAHAADSERRPRQPGRARPQLYEDEAASGGLHRAGDVWMHVDNTNFSPGNYWYNLGLNQDPGAEWPGPSGTEYLAYSSLWVGGQDAEQGRRVDQGDEIRGELADFARTRRAYDGTPGGARGVDDDGDRKRDEDFLNGKDDDADGRVDEDFAAISPEMFASEMLDYTPEAIGDGTNSDRHTPLGLRCRRSSFGWTTPGGRDFVGIHYEITNVTRQIEGGAGRTLDSVYAGMYWRPLAGPRYGDTQGNDDRVGFSRLANSGTGPAFNQEPGSHRSRDPLNLNIFWCADDNGDGGQSPGAGALLLLEATHFPRLGIKPGFTADDMVRDNLGNAPRTSIPHTYRVFNAQLPYEEGGRPVNDAQRYNALSDTSRRTDIFPDQPGSYRTLFSVGPYVALPPDSSIELDMAFCVGRADSRASTPFPTSDGQLPVVRAKFGDGVPRDLESPNAPSLVASCAEAWQAWWGTWKSNPGYDALTRFVYPHSATLSCYPADCDDNFNFDNALGDRGRESCVMAPALPSGSSEMSYYDTDDFCSTERSVLSPRPLSPTRCTWFNLDGIAASGACPLGCEQNFSCRLYRPAVDHLTWIGSVPPVPPRTLTLPGDRQVEIRWDDIAERVPSGGRSRPDFRGYRLYRAAGWKRDLETGVVGPSNDLWELIGRWTPGGELGGPIADLRDISVSDTTYDRNAPCRGDTCHVHPVGYYHFVDRQVVNGFRYFYAVTAYDEVPNPFPGKELLPTLPQLTPRAASDTESVVGRTDCVGDSRHIKVVPNPYRFRSAWDLRPSSGDPTGTHVNFNHLPCGRWTLRIFTVAGDLVQSFRESDARGSGTLEWNLESRNGQDVKAGVYVYSIESDRGSAVGRFTVIR